MNYYRFDLQQKTKKVADSLEKLCHLLDQMEEESIQLSAYDQKLFRQRLTIIDNFVDDVIEHHKSVQQYIRLHPCTHNVNHIREQLEIAKNYVRQLGGDVSTITWGRLSDYQR
jgi:hypothetical protein